MKSVCEEKNFEKIYREQASALRNFIYYRCGDLEKSEDLVQESMISLWNNCKKVVFEKAKSFLYTVALRSLIDTIRHDKVKLEFEKRNISTSDVDPSFILEEKEFKQKLEAAISSLPSGQREAFLMHRIDKMTYSDIAEALGISVKAVEKRIHLAMLHLKQKIEELKKYKI